MTTILEIALGFLIGLSLGLLGGGGSILTVPALVYLLAQTPHAAVATSLAIVGANSVIGASFHRAQGTFNWRVSILFGGAGMVAAYLSANISKSIPDSLLMIAFAFLMLVVGVTMLLRQGAEETTRAEKPLWLILTSGAGVGFLTGILGVGGGFLIVPALVMFVGLPMQMAVGTSLVIIAMNSAAGLLGHLRGEDLDSLLILLFILSGIAGSFLGARLAKSLPAKKLQNAFAWFVILLAIFLLTDNL